MSMKIQIPVAALADSHVANCLARLMEALGSAKLQDAQREVSLEKPSVAPSVPAMPKAPAPMPVAAKAEPVAAAPVVAPAVSPVVATVVASGEVKSPAAPVIPHVNRSKNVLEIEDVGERYKLFLESLPVRSRLFLDLVEKQGVVTIDEAMEALDMTVGKAMGGLTGSIARWAPDYGVCVPFEAIKDDNGRRAWRWVGMDGSGREQPVEKAVEAKPAAVAKPAKEAAKVVAAEKPKAAKAEPEESSVKPAAVVQKPVRDTEEEQRFNALLASLESSDARKFLSLVREYSRQGKKLTQSELLDACGLKRASYLGEILRPVMDALIRAGMSSLLRTGIAEVTGRNWVWGPVYDEAIAAAVAADPSFKPEEAAEDLRTRPSVRVRKRQGE